MSTTRKLLRMASKIRVKAVASLIFFGALTIVIPKSVLALDISNLLVVSTVLLAILFGFYIAATFANYTRLQSLIAEETGKLIALSNTIRSVEPTLAAEMDEAIDKYLIASFDVELLSAVEHTWKEFNEMIAVTDKIKNKDTNIFATITGFKSDLIRMRQDFDLAANRIMGTADWIVLITLAVLNILLLYSMRNTTMISSIVTVLFSTTLAIILFLLNALDNNTFAEESFSFNIYQRVFKEIGKLPYYPEVSIISKRVRPPKETYRVGVYKNREKSFDKKIKIIKVS